MADIGKFLVVCEDCPSEEMGVISEILKEKADLFIRTKQSGMRIRIQEYTGLMILGSNRYLDDPICAWESDWVVQAINAASPVPILGLCHGAQLIAFLNNRKKPLRKLKKKHKGYSKLQWSGEYGHTPPDSVVAPALAEEVWHNHGWTYELPECAVNLGNSVDHSDAFRLNMGQYVYGLQFHPDWSDEAGRRILEEWIRLA